MKNQVYINNNEIQQSLNQLLSDFQIYYQNLRAFHWLVKGPHFFEMHTKFEEFYTEAADSIDEIAERIMMIGGTPLQTFSEYLDNSRIQPKKDLERVSEIIPAIIDNVEYLLSSYRNVSEIADDAGDQGTTAMMDDYIAAAEKQLWMLNSLMVGIENNVSARAEYAE